MNRQQAAAFVADHSDDDDLDSADIDAAFTAIFEREPDDEDRDNGLWSMMIAATNDDPSCEDDEDEDEDDKPKREKYITIKDDIDYWGVVPVDFDMESEIAKITNAAHDAGVVQVYDGCEPSQETINTGTEIDWFSEWCTVANSWAESQWVEWFRKQ